VFDSYMSSYFFFFAWTDVGGGTLDSLAWRVSAVRGRVGLDQVTGGGRPGRKPKAYNIPALYILYLKHHFQRSSCVIFLQINPHSYFKLICCTSINVKRRPTRARCMRATTMAQARHAGLLTVSGQPVNPSIHLIKST
jgi:hypothetical protein